jgi:hypothetical protein
MTPEKLLDYSVKFGVLPFMLYMVFITRQDLNDTREDVKQLQGLLVDCYKQKVYNRPMGLTKNIEEGVRLYAILPNKCKTIKECLA